MTSFFKKEELAAMPKLYETEVIDMEQKPVYAKLFDPTSSWTWYVIETDGEDECFGLVLGFEAELGYFRLSELAGIQGPFGVGVERDLYFRPTTVRQVLL